MKILKRILEEHNSQQTRQRDALRVVHEIQENNILNTSFSEYRLLRGSSHEKNFLIRLIKWCNFSQHQVHTQSTGRGVGGKNTHDEYCGKVFITREINRECEESKQHARCIGWSWGCDVQGETEHQPK